ncbi:tripartite tricarboxylate transporter TctB family protein [Halalkalibacter alkaliphilus]|uniref:Tripartite tricarboxylate transporter TctB family protein n=1 Tax=Halalkalibacter alkaliphilus TaxID=2917993 RepID=A0A9X2I5V2_9BACI|nr:tripartite tricarboxylate transporter TctB family protein [Halalkalibacter alkaliphilus]MCL7748851.1 tripartite tricarboxylate transporter TctB family protein [Halalkalibacter alkaliphilus]
MKIRTNLLSGIIFGIISIVFILLVPSQVAVPTFNNGGPSPRIIPYIVLYGMLICSVALIIQSLVFKKERIVVLDFKIEKASLIVLVIMILFGIVMLNFGFIISVIVVLPILLFILRERKPFIYGFTIFGGIGVYYLFTKVFNITLPVFGG